MNSLTITQSVKDSLSKSRIIPDVLHDTKFTPKGFLAIQYSTGEVVSLGNIVNPEDAREKPQVGFTWNTPGEDAPELDISLHDRFTLVLTDPDFSARTNELPSQLCHWIAVDIELDADFVSADLKGNDVVPYIGPGPFTKTGEHRYVFILYKQKPGVTPDAVKERMNFDTGVRGQGVDEFAQKWGLEPYAVNFFYAHNEG